MALWTGAQLMNSMATMVRNAIAIESARKRPMMTWLTKDVWKYIERYNLSYSKIYDTGVKRTGCMFCMYGCHFKDDNRFELMKISHPKQYNYCFEKLGIGEVLKFIEQGLANNKNKEVKGQLCLF